MGVLELDAEKLPRVAEGRAESCIRCGHCVAVCGQGALGLDGVRPQDCQSTAPEPGVSPEQMMQYFRSRRSVRRYRDVRVPRESVVRILDTASWAPTAKNDQAVEWLVIDSADEIRRLASLVIEFLRPNPVQARLVAAWDAGEDPILRGAPLVLVAHAPVASINPQGDCTIALTHVELLAATQGLGGCWAGLLMMGVRGSAAVREALNLPAGHAAQGALMLGYQQVRYARIPPRRKARVQWR
jgi:nitroreductase